MQHIEMLIPSSLYSKFPHRQSIQTASDSVRLNFMQTLMQKKNNYNSLVTMEFS